MRSEPQTLAPLVRVNYGSVRAALLRFWQIRVHNSGCEIAVLWAALLFSGALRIVASSTQTWRREIGYEQIRWHRGWEEEPK